MSEKVPILLQRFDGGENTEDSSDALQPNESPYMENCAISTGGSIKKDDGYVLFYEDVDDTTSQISKLIKAPNTAGYPYLFKIVGDKIKVYDETEEKWETLRSGLTVGEKWGHDIADNQLIMVNEKDDALIIDLGGVARLDGALSGGEATILTDTELSTPPYIKSGRIWGSTQTYLLSVNNGSFRISINGASYDITGLNLTAAADMAGVAAIIQAAIRTATGRLETFTWNETEVDKFTLTCVDGSSASVGYATSAGVGTDISGTAHRALALNSKRAAITDRILLFEQSGILVINGAEVAYTGVSSKSFTGCTGAVATPTNSIIWQVNDSQKIPKGNMVINFGGRLIVAYGAVLNGSKASDRTDFTISGGGAVDDAVLETMPAKINAIRVFYDDDLQERIMVFCADNNIYTVNIDDDATLGTLVAIKLYKQQVTAINQFSTLVAPNDIFHIDLDNQIKTLGARTDDGSGIRFSTSMSKKRESDFRNNFDFSNSVAAILGSEYWLLAKKFGGDYNNRILIYDMSKGSWRTRTGISGSDIIEFNNELLIADSLENKIYKITKDCLSYNDSSIYFNYNTPDIDLTPMQFERLQYIKIIGVMSTNCEFYLTVFRDFKTVQLGRFTLRGNNENITGTTINGDGSFGNLSFGSQPIGTGDGTDRVFFIATLDMGKMPDFENFRIEIENDQPDVYLEIYKMKPIYGQLQKETYIPVNYIIKNNN